MAESLAGAQQVMGKLRAAQDRAVDGGMRGISLALRNTLNVSNRQVPHEDGDLERDGATSVDPARKMGAIAYGRRAQTRRYAVVQHEDMTLKHDSGRNAKYLERAIAATKDQAAAIIAAQTRKAIGS